MFPVESTVRDADLLAELDGARGKPGFEFTRMSIERKQQARDQLAAMAPGDRRRALVRQSLEETSPVLKDLRHVHSVLAICGLPYRRMPIEVRDFERKQGNMALDVTAGSLRDDRARTSPSRCRSAQRRG